MKTLNDFVKRTPKIGPPRVRDEERGPKTVADLVSNLSGVNARADKTYHFNNATREKDSLSVEDMQRKRTKTTNPDTKTEFTFEDEGTKETSKHSSNWGTIEYFGNKLNLKDIEKEIVLRVIF